MKQRTRAKMGRRVSLALTALVATGALGASDPAWSEVTGTVTSVTGDASIGERPAEMSEVVTEGESIVTGPEASCSVLVDKRSLVQFCGQAVVRLRRDVARNATILDVMEGSTKALVGPRAPDEPLEIHTPVAIAAILGTILSVTVDPVTGDTTFALEEGEVQIRARNPARTITLHAGEQITIRAGELVGEVQRLRLREAAKRADCLDSSHFHAASLEIARAERESEVTDSITRADIPDGLPPVGAPPPGPPEGGAEPGDDFPGDGGTCGLSGICSGGDDFIDHFIEKVVEEKPLRPPRCEGIPGEQCQ